MALPHTHTLTHSHTLTRSHSYTLTLLHSHALILSPSHILSHSLTPRPPHQCIESAQTVLETYGELVGPYAIAYRRVLRSTRIRLRTRSRKLDAEGDAREGELEGGFRGEEDLV